jgi:hypothetical protein
MVRNNWMEGATDKVAILTWNSNTTTITPIIVEDNQAVSDENQVWDINWLITAFNSVIKSTESTTQCKIVDAAGTAPTYFKSGMRVYFKLTDGNYKYSTLSTDAVYNSGDGDSTLTINDARFTANVEWIYPAWDQNVPDTQVRSRKVFASQGRRVIPTLVDGQTYTAYAAGTPYSLTNTSALLNFGTTDPKITITQAGDYRIKARVRLDYNGATFAASRTVTLKLRRTAPSGSTLSNSTIAVTTAIVTTLSQTFMVIEIPEIIYTATGGDVIEVWGDVSVMPTAGSLDAVEASIIATPK